MQEKVLKELILEYMLREDYEPQGGEELLDNLSQLHGKAIGATSFWKELILLEENGELVRTGYGAYGLPERMGMAAGRLQVTSKGFGFVIPDRRESGPDVFIPARQLGGAMNNDRVLARVNKDVAGRRPEGQVLRIITRANSKVVGIFVQNGDFAFVVPDDKQLGQDIYIMRKNFNGAKHGQKVVVEITQWPQEHRKAEGIIVEVLGNLGDVGLEILSIIKQKDLPLSFPEEVLAASRSVPRTIKKSELEGRLDRRDRLIVTIDGEDAKDLDDAIYVEKLGPDEYLLGVYIADVSYYVTENSLLDKEAYERGTSVYLVDRVLPMLPERLSNGICSLNAGEDRLSFACEMHISSRGELLSYEIFPTVINVAHRLSYNIVRSILAGDTELCAKYSNVVEMLQQADQLRLILHEMRVSRGAIDFDLPEQKVILNEQLQPVEIVQRVHGNAENMIEEFMLAANETVAKHMTRQQWPFVYRVHDVPAEDKMEELAKLLATFNVKFIPGEEVQPQAVQKALREMAGRPEERLVNTVALRSMRQAVYQVDNVGHFGLAAKYYTHFTSPIRRYPDLLVHRTLRRWLAQPQLKEAEREQLEEVLEAAAEHASIRERLAADAERATVDLKKAEYMAGHIGEEYDGVISGVTSFGMFVELPNGVEGLVHISSLTDDYYDYYEERYALVGTHTRHQYRLGDQVRIEVLQVNIAEASIDFIMAGENEGVKDHLRRQLQERNGGHVENISEKLLKSSQQNTRRSRKKGEAKSSAKIKGRGKKAAAAAESRFYEDSYLQHKKKKVKDKRGKHGRGKNQGGRRK